MMKFVLELIPSVLVVLLIYLILKEMYDKRTALVTSFLVSIFLLIIFNTTRMHTDIPYMVFSYLAIYYFWKGYVKQEKTKYIWFVGAFIALGFLTKLLAAMVGLTILAFLLITERLNFLKNKNLWIAFGILILVLMPYLIWSKIYYDNPLAFREGTRVLSHPENIPKTFGWHVLKYFGWYTEKIFYLIFFIGILTFYKLIIGFDLILRKKEKSLYPDLFMILLVLVALTYFVFVERDAEDRWFLVLSLPIFLTVAKGFNFIYGLIKKFNKYVAVALVALLIIWGGYHQIEHADAIVKNKLGTYSQEPIAGAWLKKHTEPDEYILLDQDHMPFRFYSERYRFDWGANETDLIKKIVTNKPKFLIIDAYVPSPRWHYEFPAKFRDNFQTDLALSENINGKEVPVIVVYEIMSYDFSKYNITF